MHLITPLAAGVKGAESGRAYLYQRGTSSLLASYYTDFEATAASSQTSTGIALDANGGATVYVDTLCHVVVKSLTGTTIRTFTAGVKDSAVEVISDSFTGTSYASAETGVSKPTTLQSVLDRWNNSAGASNFQVLVSGVATNLSAAIQGLGDFFFNVKHSSFGATGDGTTDDTASIQAAIDAANTAGGGYVVFPAGTYRTVDALTVPVTVSLLGAGPHVSAISLDSATNENALSFTGTTSTKYRFQTMTGLRVQSAQTNTGAAILIDDVNLRMENCHLVGAAAGFSEQLIQDDSPTAELHLRLVGCTLVHTGGNSSYAVSLTGTPTVMSVEVDGCVFVTTGTTVSGGAISIVGSTVCRAMVSSCVVDVSSATVALSAGALVLCTGDLVATGNYCKAPSAGSAVLFGSLVADSGGVLAESGNVIDGAGVVLTLSPFTASRIDQVFLYSRALRWRDTSTTAGTVSMDSTNYGSELVQKTSGATLTVNDGGETPVGHMYTITIWCDHAGGPLAVTWGTGFKGTNDSIANNTVRTYQFIARLGPGGTCHLYQIGTPRDETE